MILALQEQVNIMKGGTKIVGLSTSIAPLSHPICLKVNILDMRKVLIPASGQKVNQENSK